MKCAVVLLNWHYILYVVGYLQCVIDISVWHQTSFYIIILTASKVVKYGGVK